MEVDKVTQDPVSATAGDSTGAIKTKSVVPAYFRNGSMTKGDWLRLVSWAVPIIFMAAVMWVSVSVLSTKAAAHDAHLKALDEKTSELSTKQQVAA